MGYLPNEDRITKALSVIDNTHHEIHEGEYYSVCRFVTGVGAGSTSEYLIVTPSDKYVHLFYQTDGSGEFEEYLFEGTTTSNDGTAMTPRNHKRSAGDVAKTLVYHTPTVTSDGTELCQQRLGAGRTAGGISRNENEVILLQNTKYLIRGTSQSAGNTISTRIKFYEEDTN